MKASITTFKWFSTTKNWFAKKWY